MRNAPIITGVALAAALALGLTFALAGCVQSNPPVIPTSQTSSRPVFATDADALAAAKKAFAGYLAASDEIGNDGGRDPSRLAPWVTSEELEVETKTFHKFEKTGNRIAGHSTVTSFKLQQLTPLGDRSVSVVTYICDDVSGSRLLNAKGSDITPSTRIDVYPLEVTFVSAAAGSKSLKIERSESWSGTDFC